MAAAASAVILRAESAVKIQEEDMWLSCAMGGGPCADIICWHALPEDNYTMLLPSTFLHDQHNEFMCGRGTFHISCCNQLLPTFSTAQSSYG